MPAEVKVQEPRVGLVPRAVREYTDAGDEVLVHLEESARHFGMKIEESIVEK